MKILYICFMYPFVWVREVVFVLKMEFDTALNIKLYRLVHFLEMRELSNVL